MKRLIVTDSTADIPEKIARKLNIVVMPVNILLDGKLYKDGVDIKHSTLYEKYDTYKSMATAPIVYEEYLLKYMQWTKKYDELIIFHCSSALSDSYNIAKKIEAEYQDHSCRVEIIDSKSCSLGFGMAVIAAAEATRRGREFGSVVYKANHILNNTTSYLAIPTLKYLRKRKKIGGFKSLLGLAIGVKPVLGFEDGRLEVKTKLFGKHPNMILSMLDMIKQDIGDHPISLGIAHGRDTGVVQNLKDVFEQTFDCKRIVQTYFGPAISINAGPDAIGVMFYKHSKK